MIVEELKSVSDRFLEVFLTVLGLKLLFAFFDP